MLLLPLIYLAIVALTAVAVWGHAVHNTWLILLFPGRAAIIGIVAYLTPLIAGALLVLFMFKPLLARPEKAPPSRPLSQRDAPSLFALVDGIADAVKAPRPRRIDLDILEVNASASLRRGWLSMVLPGDLVLTLSLPLVAGLTVRELAGVIAHELGHFGQGAGMRLSYIIGSINFWFARVVHQRDRWDVRLMQWSHSGTWFRVPFYVTRFFVWLSRGVLRGLMWVGQVISSAFSRQMEYGADRMQTELAGSASFEPTFRKMTYLSVAMQLVYNDLESAWHERRLGDDLVQLVLARVVHMPPEVREAIQKERKEETTGLFDTHPATRDRIDHARALDLPGIFALDGRAPQLFVDFEGLSRQMTFDHYRDALGEQVSRENLVPSRQMMERSRRVEEEMRAASRYFQDTLAVLRPIVPPLGLFDAPAEEGGSEALAARLREARQQVVDLAPQARKALEKYLKTDGEYLDAGRGLALLKAGFQFPPELVGMKMEPTVNTVSVVRDKAARGRTAAGTALDAVQAASLARLSAALRLLAGSHRAEAALELRRARQLLGSLAAFERAWQHVLEMRDGFSQLAVLVDALQHNAGEQTLQNELHNQVHLCDSQIRKAFEALGQSRYPFEHVRDGVTLADYVFDGLPTAMEPPARLGEVYGKCEGGLDRLISYYVRCMGSLARIAEAVEQELGLDPLPTPPDDEQGQA